MPGDILIEIKNLVMERDKKRVLDIPHLCLSSGLTYALMGPNGAGKTTLLHLLNRLIKPSRGSVTFEGIDLFADGKEGRRLQRRMTLVMQSPLLFDTTVFDNVSFGLKARGIDRPAIAERVLRHLARVGLNGYEKRRARQLSGGETRRVALARAMALEPELLLLDEPTAFIDRGHANFIEQLILELSANPNMSIIFSTHNIRQAHRLADEVINLHMGSVWPSDMVNLFRGSVKKDGGLSTFNTGALSITLPGNVKDVGYIAIDPRGIALSKTFPNSSDPNLFAGRVTRIENLDSNVLLTVDIGERLVIEIPREIFFEFGLTLDSHVWLTINEKAMLTF